MHLKSLVIASSGGALELYNFITFRLLATIFIPQFLPESTNIVQINVFTFEIIVIGYIARIVGSFLFAPIGDKYGRRKGILLSFVLSTI